MYHISLTTDQFLNDKDDTQTYLLLIFIPRYYRCLSKRKQSRNAMKVFCGELSMRLN